MCACVHAKSLQLCLTLCNYMDCSPPGSSVHAILQARILEWAVIPFSRGASWPRDQTWASHVAAPLRKGWMDKPNQKGFCGSGMQELQSSQKITPVECLNRHLSREGIIKVSWFYRLHLIWMMGAFCFNLCVWVCVCVCVSCSVMSDSLQPQGL